MVGKVKLQSANLMRAKILSGICNCVRKRRNRRP
jgi:hypothetical protein